MRGKEKFRKEGVRVVSVCQETNDDPVGQLIEGIFECIMPRPKYRSWRFSRAGSRSSRRSAPPSAMPARPEEVHIGAVPEWKPEQEMRRYGDQRGEEESGGDGRASESGRQRHTWMMTFPRACPRSI